MSTTIQRSHRLSDEMEEYTPWMGEVDNKGLKSPESSCVQRLIQNKRHCREPRISWCHVIAAGKKREGAVISARPPSFYHRAIVKEMSEAVGPMLNDLRIETSIMPLPLMVSMSYFEQFQRLVIVEINIEGCYKWIVSLADVMQGLRPENPLTELAVWIKWSTYSIPGAGMRVYNQTSSLGRIGLGLHMLSRRFEMLNLDIVFTLGEGEEDDDLRKLSKGKVKLTVTFAKFPRVSVGYCMSSF
ncbi:hypothetical protein C8J56DRAFT_890600 [Mycena floridula]|nr:hypothetical protein C8J56DRAFT_890600 [Mycena floridula]